VQTMRVDTNWGNKQLFLQVYHHDATTASKGMKPLGKWLILSKVNLKWTLWEPGYDTFLLQFQPKTSSCQLPYQRPSYSTDCTRELFKGLNGSDSLLDYTQKNFLGGECGFSVSDIVSEVVLGSFWLMLPGLRPNH